VLIRLLVLFKSKKLRSSEKTKFARAQSLVRQIMDTIIEDANIRLIVELYEIEKKCFEEEGFSKQQICYLLEDYNAVSLVARVGKEIVGFIIGRVDLIRNQPVGHIMTIDVAPEYRRQGIAQKLMLETEAIFKTKGAKECRLEVRESNTEALKLYTKLGYEKISLLEHYYGKAHGFYFRKAPL
jgi:ribosomal-protein-alanine N-acetyltransferase